MRAIFNAMKRAFWLFFIVFSACSESKVIGIVGETDTGEMDTGETDTEEESEDETDVTQWDGATLVLEQPLSGDFLPYGEDAEFVAAVYSADGERMDFDDITWGSDIEDDWSLTGSDLTNSSLDIGSHSITAEAILPNGDRLQSTMGGILVQHEDAGIYVGDIRVNITLSWDGADYAAGCIGAITVLVDAYGESAVGDSSCVISLLGFEQDLTYNFDMVVDEGDLTGAAAVDLVIFSLDFDVNGTITDGVMTGSWEDSELVEIAGDLNANRITRDISE
jgi:hypothetical protein